LLAGAAATYINALSYRLEPELRLHIGSVLPVALRSEAAATKSTNCTAASQYDFQQEISAKPAPLDKVDGKSSYQKWIIDNELKI